MNAEPKFDTEGRFHGFAESECQEHRTVGSHRAWCHDCTEWCYPSNGCKGCYQPALEAENARLRELLTVLRSAYPEPPNFAPFTADLLARVDEELAK